MTSDRFIGDCELSITLFVLTGACVVRPCGWSANSRAGKKPSVVVDRLRQPTKGPCPLDAQVLAGVVVKQPRPQRTGGPSAP